MENNNKKSLEEQIKKIDEMSEKVSWNNAGETLQDIGDEVDNFLILHSAFLKQFLNDSQSYDKQN